MLIKVISERGHDGRPLKREPKEIPAGSWGITILRQREDYEPFGIGSSRTTSIEFVGPTPNEDVLKWQYAPPPRAETEGNLADDNEMIAEGLPPLFDDTPPGLTIERVLYWSDQPFIVLEQWENPLEGRRARLASLINAHGLTPRLPDLDLPPIAQSPALSYGGKPTKWVKLTDLAERCGLHPLQLVKLHLGHFEGIDKGVYVVRAQNADALMELEDRSDYHPIWTRPELRAFFSSDPSDAWVRLRFAQVVMYFHRLGWHEQFKQAAASA